MHDEGDGLQKSVFLLLSLESDPVHPEIYGFRKSEKKKRTATPPRWVGWEVLDGMVLVGARVGPTKLDEDANEDDDDDGAKGSMSSPGVLPR